MKKIAFSVFAAALTFGANAESNVETAVAADRCCGYDGFYFGLGVAAVDQGVNVERKNTTGTTKNSDHSTRLAGTLAAGYGKAIQEKAYLGLEAGLDAAQSTEYFGINSDNRVKVNGLIPSVALKLGYVHPATKGMVFLKAGAAYSKAQHNSLYYIGEDKVETHIKNAKWSPIIALGGEKLCGKNFRTRLEAEYRFRTNKSVSVNHKQGENNIYDTTTKLINKGAITLRAMAIYTFKK